MPRLREIAARHQVRLVEDSAVAQGGMLDGRPAGLWGGAVVTGDPELGQVIRMPPETWASPKDPGGRHSTSEPDEPEKDEE